jgi:hypothetical protein
VSLRLIYFIKIIKIGNIYPKKLRPVVCAVVGVLTNNHETYRFSENHIKRKDAKISGGL